ncbi:MAG: hypothetical protein P1S60_17795 [Anaerolineae bacterium]|nr:hypothetical protein [Anaerolineae bacterium]
MALVPLLELFAYLISMYADDYDTTQQAIALAWLLRHPAAIQPIIGTSRPERVIASCQADAVALSREAWYRLYIAGRGKPLP